MMCGLEQILRWNAPPSSLLLVTSEAIQPRLGAEERVVNPGISGLPVQCVTWRVYRLIGDPTIGFAPNNMWAAQFSHEWRSFCA